MVFDNDISTKFPKQRYGEFLLAAERAKASFDVNQLSTFMYTKEWLEKINKVLKVMESEPAFDKSRRYFMGREEKIKSALQEDVRLLQVAKENNWDETENGIALFLYDQGTPFTLHANMFIPVLLGQTTDEQKKLFLYPALKRQIIGCYAQTELGHGSNIQGLETTATYIPETNEFELHSPTLTSSKWWIGGIGVASNYAIVMARLITKGKDHGPHPFCVPIRSLEDHRPLPGITVGDIGPKIGLNSVDLGFIVFDHYRVPHVSFLAKYSQVQPSTGIYSKPSNSKLSYGTMVYVRAHIVMGARYALARAVTIAIRYSTVRQQLVGNDNPKKFKDEIIESPVLDCTMQQYRLLPVVAAAYACFFTETDMIRLYHLNQREMKKGNFDLLADLHASSSGLKSLTTTMAVKSIEECRSACGSHEYSMFSGLNSIYQNYLPNVTWEGDNYVLTQQTARYLLKTYRQVVTGKAKPSEYNLTISYLTQYQSQPHLKCLITDATDFNHAEVILSAFGFRAAYLISQAAKEIDINGRSWNSMLVDIHHISKAHCQFVLVRNFIIALQQEEQQQQQKRQLGDSELCVLFKVASLFSLSIMEQELKDFIICGYLSTEQSRMLKQQVVLLLEEIRPEAVALVDAFALPDYYLNSALGRYDGKVYESLTKMVEDESLNHTLVVDDYENCIKPFIVKGNSKL